MWAFSCTTLEGATQASTLYSPVLVIMSCSLRLEEVVPCSLPRPTCTPQPPTQETSPLRLRLRAGSTPLVS